MSMGTETKDTSLKQRSQDVSGQARILSAGRGITGVEKGREQAAYWVANEMEARKAVQDNAAKRVDIIKIWVDDRDDTVPKLTPAQYGAVIDEAHKANIRVTAHIFDLDDAKGLLKANVDAFAHGVRDRDVDDEFMTLVRGKPNLVLNPQSAGTRRADGPVFPSRKDLCRGIRRCAEGQCRQRQAGGSVRDPSP